MIDNDIKLEALPWTGERYLPEIHGNIELEHLHRYLFASRLSLGKRILDIASGEGYGSALLAQNAMSVVGVDISAEAVSHAKAMYQAGNLEFKIGSCHAIPLPDHSVDMVVSFETIEHHDEHEAMMREIKRVMISDGLLVISSPDKLEYSDKPGYTNPYHIKELYRGQFTSLLSKHFKHHHVAGQRVVYGSAIFGEDGCGGIRSFDINDKLLLATPGIARALYLVAVASDAELPFPESGILEQTVSQSDEVSEGIRKINVLTQALADREGQIVNLKDQIACIGSVIEDKERQLNQILQSRSWRLTAPLRKGVLNIREAVRSPRKSFLGKTASYLRARSDVFPESAVSQTLAVGHDDVLYDDVFNAAIDAEVETIRKSGLFDEAFYHSMYPDLEPLPTDAIRHYCEFGWREGRDPSVDFNTNFYLASNSDIRDAGINPFLHYVVAGASELRPTAPDLAARYEDDIRFGVVETDIKLLAFYSSPDWAEVRGERSNAKGPRQTLLPSEELGFYDPLDRCTLMGQAQLAKRHGLYGFCFQLDTGTDGAATTQPVDILLAHADIDFRFCIEAGLHSENIPEFLVVAIVQAVSDRRYIHLKGRPVILVTLPGKKQLAAAALGYLRRQLAQLGIDNPFVIGRFASAAGDDLLRVPLVNLADLCDAALDLPSDPIPEETGSFLPLDKNGIDTVPYCVVVSQGVARTQAAQDSAQPLFHCVTLARDNTASKAARPLVYTHFHLPYYRRWLDAAIAGARAAHPGDSRFVFVNGWNNWNESLFLEPDRQGGFGRANETTRALLGIASGTSMPRISVIVPNYNHDRFLRRRLSSIYGQTYKNIEVILLDDCSSDRSRSVLDQYATAYPEITRTLYNDRNSGSPFRQWAKGIKAATGDLVWVAESDDFCDERFLEVLVRCFDDEMVMLAYSKCVFVDRNGVPMRDEFKIHLSDLECAEKWNASYVEAAHNEVRCALGIKNTIPNASGVLFRRPIDMALLDDESWLSMVAAGDWMFYLQLIRGGKIAYSTGTTNFFRRHEDNAAEATYKKEVFYREVGMASKAVATLYDVPMAVFEQCQMSFRKLYEYHVGGNDEEFSVWYNYESVLRARKNRLPNVMVATMGFYPGGAEILPIRLANEFKRQGFSVLMLSAGFNMREEGVRRMLRNDIPVVETSDVNEVKKIIRDFGVEVLNTHQWHIQKYPVYVPDVFDQLHAHVASLHGMIEHGNASEVSEEHLRKADHGVTTWVYTAEKNLVPFSDIGLYDKSSPRFVKIPNGLQPPHIIPIPRSEMGIPENAFALCCVSRAIPDKGWAETILAVERARALSGRDIRLILVGNGPVYDDYRRVGVPDFVYLAGFSANSVGHYAAADMGIMLTMFKSESFPLTIVDCLFAGKPYIATDVGDIRNMLTTSDDVAGEVIELEDWEVPVERTAQIVAAFATDKQKYANAVSLVQSVANRYRIDVVASQYIRLFTSSCNKNQALSRGNLN